MADIFDQLDGGAATDVFDEIAPKGDVFDSIAEPVATPQTPDQQQALDATKSVLTAATGPGSLASANNIIDRAWEDTANSGQQVLQGATGVGSIAFANELYKQAEIPADVRDKMDRESADGLMKLATDSGFFDPAQQGPTRISQQDIKQAPKPATFGEPFAFDNPTINSVQDFGQAYQTPLVTLPKPDNTGPVSGIVRGIEGAVEGLSTPMNIALLSSIGGAPVAMQRIASAGFAAQMGLEIPKQIAEARAAQTPGEAAEKWTNAIITSVFTLMAASHANSRMSAGEGTRPSSLTPDQANRASVENQQRAMVPENKYSNEAQRVLDSSTVDGLILAKEKLRSGFQDQPKEVQKARDESIDLIDNQLLRFSREDVSAAEARVKEQRALTETALPQGASPVPEVPPTPAVSTGGPPAEGGRSSLFAQARREAGITDEAQVQRTEQRPQEAAPEAQRTAKAGAPVESAVPGGIDPEILRTYTDSAERIADQVSKGQPTAVRDAARDAALDNARSSLEVGKTPSVSFMRKSAQKAAGEAAGRQAESLDSPVNEGQSLADTIPAESTRVSNEELYNPLNDVLDSTLSERDSAIVRAVQERSMEDVAAEYGMTKQRVSQIVKESIPKLRAALEERGITKDDYAGGPGAMGPVEALEMKANEVTGTKNAQVEAERIRRGEEPLLKEEPISNVESIAKAHETLAADPARADVLVEELNTTNRDVRTISVADEAVLMAHKVDLMNERNAQEAILADGNRSLEEHAVAKQRLDDIEQKMNAVDQATYASGSEWGRMGQLRQRLLRQDYSLESMERKARIQKGEALTPEEKATIKQQSEKIQELTDKLEKETKRANEAAATKAIDEAVSALKKESAASTSPESRFAPRVLALAESIVTRLDKSADAARQRIRERLKNANAAVDPTVIYDVAVIGVSKLARASLDFVKWSAEMKADLGDWVEPHLADAWKQAEELWKAEEKRLNPSDRTQVAKVRAKKGDTAAAETNIKNTIKARAADGDVPADVQSLVQKLALNFVRAGETTRDGLVEKVHGVLKESFKDITPEQTRDMISGYGEFKQLDKEAAKVTLRGLKGELQQVSKIENMQAGQAPKKTGMERRTPTDEERRLTKEVNELKKKGGFTVTDPTTQLKSAMDAIKTRLNNEIRDLDTAIATQERLPAKKNVLEYDAEAKALKDQRDAKRAQYDELFPKEPLTEAQQLDRTSKALDRSIAQLESDIKAGKLYGDKGRKLTSPEIDAKNARLEALREERQTLRDLDTATIEAKQEQRLLKAIDDAQKAIPEPKEVKPTVDSQRIAELKQTLQEARDARASSPESQQRKMESATEAIKKQISEYDRRLREGDTSTRTQREGLRSDELDTLRNERDALERAYREMVNSEKPKKTRDEIALQAYKTRTANRIAELNERIAKEDFSTRPPRPETKLDKAALDLKAEIQKTKEKFDEGLLKYRLAQRSPTQKIIGGIAETLNTSRAILTSIDLSGVLRQGGFVTFGNPLRAARAIPDMLKAFASEAAQRRSVEQIKARPNFNLYEKAKLYLSDTGSHSLTKMEEAYMSRWAKKIPLVAGSERAYTSFLNRIRADTFDAMINSLGGKDGISLQEAKIIANFVNVATGRGSLGKAGQAATGLNTIFFSPRYVASRFQLMAEPLAGFRFGEGANARTRIAIAKEYGKFLTGIALVYALGKSAGATIEEDPRSSDFGKLKFGNTRVDPMGGLLQNTTLLSRIATGQKKVTSGAIRTLRPREGEKRRFGDETTADVMMRFARSKFSPILGSGFDLASGQNVIGQKVTPTQVAVNSVVPMSLKDVADTMKEQGVPEGTIFTILSLFGLGVQTYDNKKPK